MNIHISLYKLYPSRIASLLLFLLRSATSAFYSLLVSLYIRFIRFNGGVDYGTGLGSGLVFGVVVVVDVVPAAVSQTNCVGLTLRCFVVVIFVAQYQCHPGLVGQCRRFAATVALLLFLLVTLGALVLRQHVGWALLLLVLVFLLLQHCPVVDIVVLMV